jgi:hypothetical protein
MYIFAPVYDQHYVRLGYLNAQGGVGPEPYKFSSSEDDVYSRLKRAYEKAHPGHYVGRATTV